MLSENEYIPSLHLLCRHLFSADLFSGKDEGRGKIEYKIEYSVYHIRKYTMAETQMPHFIV